MSFKTNQQITVGGVLKKGNKVLLLQRTETEKVLPGLWELPSGKKELIETAEQAALREFKEETGLKVKIIRPLAIFDYHFYSQGKRVYVTQINFIMRLKSRDKSQIKLSREHSSYGWFSKRVVYKLKVSAEVKKVLALVFSV